MVISEDPDAEPACALLSTVGQRESLCYNGTGVSFLLQRMMMTCLLQDHCLPFILVCSILFALSVKCKHFVE